MEDLHAYLLASSLNNRGHCQCGWAGKRRWLRGSAVLDVLDHCAGTGHVPVAIPPVTLGRKRGLLRAGLFPRGDDTGAPDA
jgi:hypothetical protein